MSSITLLILTLLVIIGELIDRIVGQVHISVVNIRGGRSLIRLCAKASEGHLVKVDSQRLHSIEHNVKPQIIF
jgi:hypothetical protein